MMVHCISWMELPVEMAKLFYVLVIIFSSPNKKSLADAYKSRDYDQVHMPVWSLQEVLFASTFTDYKDFTMQNAITKLEEFHVFFLKPHTSIAIVLKK